MSSCKRWIIMPLILIGVFASGNVFANGINPPRAKGNSTVLAICLERSTQRKDEIYRAVIKSGNEMSKMLRYRVGDAINEIFITDLALLTLSAEAVDPDGFVKATLVRRGEPPTKEEDCKIQIKSKDNDLFLQGFDKAGSRLSIALSECSRIEFFSDTSDTHDPGLSPKK